MSHAPTQAITDPSGTIASRLASAMTQLTLDAVPAEVTTSAKHRTLDMLGNIIASQSESGPRALKHRELDDGGRPDASIIGDTRKLPAPRAALVNGTFGHAQDFDDTHHASRIHASTVVVPAALAAAEAAGADGATTLRAIIAGLETVVRTGMVAPGRFHERGLHATSLCGVMGAAAAASVANDHDATTLAHAFGIAGSLASGLREAYLGQPTDTKSLHAGWAAQAGVQATRLAADGFTGPTTVFEGRFGFLHAYLSPEDHDAERIVENIAERWHTPEIAYKLYPCGSLIHAMIDAAITLHERHHPTLDDLDQLTCIAPPGMVSTVLEPISQKLEPQSGYHAKFSAQYAVLCGLLDGEISEASFSEERVHDPARRRALRDVRYETDDAMPWPDKYPGGVRIRLRDGREDEVRFENASGSIDRPATEADIVRKFRANVRNHIDASASDEVITAIFDLESVPALGPILANLATTPD